MQKTSWLQETLSENQSTSSKQEAHLLFIQLSIYLSKWVVLRLTVSCSFELSSSSLQLKCLIFELDNFNCNDSFAFTNCVALEKLYNFSRPTFIFLLQGFILSVRKVVGRCWEAARDKEKEIYHQLVVFQNGFNNLNYIREKPGSWNSTWFTTCVQEANYLDQLPLASQTYYKDQDPSLWNSIWAQEAA